MRKYEVFARSWYDSKGNPKIGRKTHIAYVSGIEAAQKMCSDFNNNRDSRQIKRGYKYEFTAA